jgi:hypothetical protein
MESKPIEIAAGQSCPHQGKSATARPHFGRPARASRVYKVATPDSPLTNDPAPDKGNAPMRRPAAASSKAGRSKNATWSAAARRILQQILKVDPDTIDESQSLSDFEGCALPDIFEPLSRMAWRIRVQDRVFSYFGVNCDLDEPLSTLVARIELAERGVRYVPAH